MKEYKVIIMAFFAALAVAILAYFYCGDDDYWSGVAVEAGGVLWEVVLFIVILGTYEKKRRKDDDVKNLKRRINDFKMLDDSYGKSIIGSCLRELKELGFISGYDFRGMKLSNFSFPRDFGIVDLSNSIFSEGFSFGGERNSRTELSKVSFFDVNCENVIFSTGFFSFSKYEDCSFCRANLKNANFSGTTLIWSKDEVRENEMDWYSHEGYEENGQPILMAEYYPPFYEACLDGVNFDGCQFSNVDFRKARNVLNASFKDVQGIDTCFFDDGVLKELKEQGSLTEKDPKNSTP